MEAIVKIDENGYTDVEVPVYYGSGETYEEAEMNAKLQTTNRENLEMNVQAVCIILIVLMLIMAILAAYINNRNSKNKKE